MLNVEYLGIFYYLKIDNLIKRKLMSFIFFFFKVKFLVYLIYNIEEVN